MNGYPTTPCAPESSQPGGGFCKRIEDAWGRMRRCCLRLFRPGYVRRMRERRQGRCDRFDGEVIDHRDLKYLRPVCGFWFEGAPHPGKPFLGLARFGLCETLVFSFVFLAATAGLAALAAWVHWGFALAAAVPFLVWLEVIYFFRDPERTTVDDPDALVGPADGRITHIEEVEEVDFPGKALRISMFLSIFNVHVNRMPWSARITQTRYFPGAFLDARDPNSAVRNEQLWIDAVDPAGTPLRLKQISGAVARRIVCFLKPGDDVRKGERIGMIKLGSRTDLIIPAERVREVCIKVGDRVRGARTVLLRVK